MSVLRFDCLPVGEQDYAKNFSRFSSKLAALSTTIMGRIGRILRLI